MNIHHFNALLLVGWLMLVIGLSLWSVPAGLAVGGVVLLGITLFLGIRAGVRVAQDKNEG